MTEDVRQDRKLKLVATLILEFLSAQQAEVSQLSTHLEEGLGSLVRQDLVTFPVEIR